MTPSLDAESPPLGAENPPLDVGNPPLDVENPPLDVENPPPSVVGGIDPTILKNSQFVNGHTITREEIMCDARLDKLGTQESETVGVAAHHIMTKPLKIPEPEVTCRTMGKTHGVISRSSFLLKYDTATLTRGLDHPEDIRKRKPPDTGLKQILEGPHPSIDHTMEDTGRPPPLGMNAKDGTHHHRGAELVAMDAWNSLPRMRGTCRHGCAKLAATQRRRRRDFRDFHGSPCCRDTKVVGTPRKKGKKQEKKKKR